MSDPKPLHVLVLGAGIAGLSAALALSHPNHLSPGRPPPRITILELRPTPSNIGGAVNLTPPALRYLSHLGVLPIILSNNSGAECRTIDLFDLYTGSKLSSIDFRGPEGHGINGFIARRVMRAELQRAMLDAVSKLSNTEVLFGKKTISISETPDSVSVELDDDSTMTSDILLGCDGIHSALRTLHVEPLRKTDYTGIAVAMAFSPLSQNNTSRIRWKDTMLASSRRGSFMASYFEPSRSNMYVCAISETAEVVSREGWKVKSADQEDTKKEIMQRFGGKDSGMEELKGLIEASGEWFLYPVYKLSPKGAWVSREGEGRCVLLGDAAHAMPPQGESTALAIEDSIVLARCLNHYPHHPIGSIFKTYECIRRPKIDAAYDEASRRWETVKDSGWLVHKMMMLIMPWFLWWTKQTREDGFKEDLTGLEISIIKENASRPRGC